MTSNFFKTVLFFLSAFLFVSCDKDFNEIGTDLVGDDHYDLVKKEDTFITAGTIATGPVQTNNLDVVPFGIYNDPRFGTLTANYVTQVELASADPDLDDLIDIDKVRLYIPYFATHDKTVDTEKIYTLDSIFGDRTTTMNLKVKENTYFLRSQEVVDGATEEQPYYNDMFSTIQNHNAGSAVLNNSANIAETSKFFFNNKEFKTYKREADVTDTDSTEVKQTPGMYLTLSKAFFKQKILQAPAGALSNNNVFKNYFRGLYFELSDKDKPAGVINTLDFKKGVITIFYRRNITTTTGGVTVTNPRRFELKLNLTGNSVSLTKQENAPQLPTDRLVVKGGEGYITMLDMITADERAQMMADSLMINEANLIFHVDEAAMLGATKPRRLYLYDMTNSQPLIDYVRDGSTSPDPKRNRNVFGGLLDSIKDGQGNKNFFYKFRVTNYLRGLVSLPDSTVVRLGVSTTENILENAMVRLKNPVTVTDPSGTKTYKKLPKASVMHPFGVVLHGPDSNVPEERLKLVIYYTKPEETPGN